MQTFKQFVLRYPNNFSNELIEVKKRDLDNPKIYVSSYDGCIRVPLCKVVETVKRIIELLRGDTRVIVYGRCVEYSEWRGIRAKFVVEELLVEGPIRTSDRFATRAIIGKDYELIEELHISVDSESRFDLPQNLFNRLSSIVVSCEKNLTKEFVLCVGEKFKQVVSVDNEFIICS